MAKWWYSCIANQKTRVCFLMKATLFDYFFQ